MAAEETPEQKARARIDAMLIAAGWTLQSVAQQNLGAAPGVAVREFMTDAGPCDYLLFVGGKAAGVIEAKAADVLLSPVEAQTMAYAAKVPAWVSAPVRPLPFRYESNGEEVWFTDGRDPVARARRVFSFHRPETLAAWLTAATPGPSTLMGRMRIAPPLNKADMWPAQIRAVENLEASIREGRHRRALIQMATGGGKTFTAITALYRLIRYGGARRVLFLVDRGNLGRQAHKEFQGYTAPDDGRKFTELYPVVNLAHQQIDPVNKVVITTIQRLYSILKGEPTFDASREEESAFAGGVPLEPPPVVYNRDVPPEFFDLVVVDECHRSIYTLWRQVLEYFDAHILGLTATPAKQTFAFFDKNVVSEYRHEDAVRDKVNVGFEVYAIRTRITEQGATLVAEDDTSVGVRDRRTRKQRWEKLDDDLTYGAGDLDRSVVAIDQIRTVVREFRDKLFTDIFPGRKHIPKTLFFAKDDNHAEDILRIVREEFGLPNEGAVKITYRGEKGESPTAPSKKPEDLIKSFRNSYHPRIAVTVDMIATGTDIKPLECLVFMRQVKSRALFEQMKGRGVRVVDDADLAAVTPDAGKKDHFVIVDCVGVCADRKVDPPLIRDRTVSLSKLLRVVRDGCRDADVLATLAGRLDRLERRLSDADRKRIAEASPDRTLREIVAGLVDALDEDREEQRARSMAGLPDDAEPTAEQLAAAQKVLRDEAAAPLAFNPPLRNVLLEIRQNQEQTVDYLSLDAVTRSERAREHEIDYAAEGELVQRFQAFIAENREEIEALQILYERPYGKRLTRAQIRALADAITRPPRQWTPDALWAAYERVERGRVRGASAGRLWTDLVALARHALHPDADLVPFADEVAQRFEAWLNQQRPFSPEQMAWLLAIRDRIAADAEVRVDDLDEAPFDRLGGLGQAYDLFGEELETVVRELNEELVA
jgi:type I restriction enzyme R subunit